METLKDFLLWIPGQQITIQVWELLLLVVIGSICLLFRATKFGLLLTYIFVMHITWNFVKLNLSLTSLMSYFILGGVVLTAGFISLIHDD